MNSIKVLFQNQDFIAVDKNAGVSVHNNEDPENLLEILEKQLKVKQLFPVHRLDKETSGIQILAFNTDSARTFSEAFQSREVKKIYRGILRGQIKNDQGIWAQPLTDKSEGRRNPQGSARDRIPCETRFRVLRKSQYFSLLEFDLTTGRQHQIRKHCALNNHPLVGDSRYGEPKYNQKISEQYGIPQMCLHCTRIEILGYCISSPEPELFNRIF